MNITDPMPYANFNNNRRIFFKELFTMNLPLFEKEMLNCEEKKNLPSFTSQPSELKFKSENFYQREENSEETRFFFPP